MTENAVRFLAKNELGHFSTARFWPGPSLDWRSPHWHLMGFLCYSSLIGTMSREAKFHELPNEHSTLTMIVDSSVYRVRRIDTI